MMAYTFHEFALQRKDMNMPSESEIRRMICDIGKRIYDRGMVAANDGNISVKLGDDEYLCTPTGVSKGFMTPESICRIDGNGNPLGDNISRPSSEIKMHLRVYEKRPDAGAVVHTHAAFATSFAVTGQPLNRPIMSEAVVSLGCVPLAKFATPSTSEVPDSIEPYLNDFDAVLLENHGALTWASDLESAYLKMESVEFYAQLMYRSAVLGKATGFTKQQIDDLVKVRHKMNIAGRHPSDRKSTDNCYKCDRCIWR